MTTVTKEMIGAALDVMLAKGDFVLSANLLERIYLAMDAKKAMNRRCETCSASALSDGLGALPTMADAMAAGDSVLINEQAALLRECRRALDDLLRQKPMMACMLCGSNSLGNLRAELYAYRPQGVFNGQAPNAALTGAEGVRVEGTVMQQTKE